MNKNLAAVQCDSCDGFTLIDINHPTIKLMKDNNINYRCETCKKAKILDGVDINGRNNLKQRRNNK